MFVRYRPIVCLPLLLAALPAVADDLKVNEQDSIVAVITHKAGVGARLAHNHLIAATDYQLRLDFDPGQPLATRAELTARTEKLDADSAALQQKWFPRIQELGILDEPFAEMSQKDRGKVREAMLGKKQLDAQKFPELKARITGVEEQPAKIGKVEFPYTATLALEVHGKTVEKPLAARFDAGGERALEGVGTFKFSDFGIEPYSAMLGAVKNEDTFHVFVHLKGDE